MRCDYKKQSFAIRTAALLTKAKGFTKVWSEVGCAIAFENGVNTGYSHNIQLPASLAHNKGRGRCWIQDVASGLQQKFAGGLEDLGL